MGGGTSLLNAQLNCARSHAVLALWLSEDSGETFVVPKLDAVVLLVADISASCLTDAVDVAPAAAVEESQVVLRSTDTAVSLNGGSELRVEFGP